MMKSLALLILSVCGMNAFAQGLSGTKTIGGATPDYGTLKAAFRDLTLRGVQAPGVTFLIRSGTYNEDSLVIRTTTTSATAHVIIKPDLGASVVVNVRPPVAATFDFAILVDSTKYVTFDGSNNGTTSRNLTINATGGFGRRGLWFSGNCSHGVVKNCIVTAGRDTITSAVSSFYRAIDFLSLTGAGNDADSILIENNLVKYAHIGIRFQGSVSGDGLNGAIIRNNVADSICNNGVYGFNCDNVEIHNNDVNALRGAATQIIGILVGTGSYNARVHGNRIHDLNQLSTTSDTYGMQISSSTSTTDPYAQHRVYNNFIWGINVPSTGTGVIYGIWDGVTFAAAPDTFAFNSVSLSGGSTGIRHTYAFYKGSATGSAVVLNNIFHNTRSDSTASVVAIGKTSAATVLLSNNNNLYVPVTADTFKNVGRIGAVRYKTLANWQAANSSDAQSFSENTPFVSATDLHIQTTVPTRIESGAISVAGIATDIDGNARSATTPDVGADEGVFMLLDLAAPSIQHTPLTNTNATGPITASAIITDATGIATGAGAPRLWHRTGATGAFAAVTSDSVRSSVYYFSIPGRAAGSLVQYYFGAQDIVSPANVGTLPSGGSGVNPPGSTAPATFFSYVVRNPIAAGTHTVGVGGAYPTLDSAFNRLEIDGIAGPVTFALNDTVYGAPDSPIRNPRIDAPSDTIPAIVLTGPILGANSTNRVTIRPAAGKNVRFLSSGAIGIRLVDASFVTFDGINSGGTSLLLQTAAGIGIQFEGNSDNCTIQNMKFSTPAFTAVQLQAVGNDVPDNFLMWRNAIGGYALNGFLAVNGATSVTSLATGLRILENDFGTATDSLRQSAIVLQYVRGAIVEGNVIQNIYKSTLSGNTIGISVVSLHVRTIIRNNVIKNIGRRAGTLIGVAAGIQMNGRSQDTTEAVIANNMIYGLIHQATNPNGNIRGIFMDIGLRDTIAYNSISLSGTDPATMLTAALWLNFGPRNLVVRNNIIINGRSATGSGRALGVYMADTANVTFTSNYNDLYVASQALSHVGGRQLVNYTTLADWRAGSRQDANSISVNANFRNPDLHIDTTIATPINGGATPLPGYTTDFDGQTRSPSTPDIGADEFGPTTSVTDRAAGIPDEFNLEQNYPNPFNPATTFKYALPKTSRVTIVVFNLVGQRIATLVDGERSAGYHAEVWDGHNDNRNTVASGVYIYQIEATATDGSERFSSVKKMLLIR